MPARCDPALDFEHSQLNEAVELWRQTAQGREMPRRRDMTARALKQFLPNLAIVDAVDNGGVCRFRMRLMGTALAELLGDHTGRFIDEFVRSPFHERWCAIFSAAIAAGEPVRVFGRIEYRQLDYIAIEMMAAPIDGSPSAAKAVLIVAQTSFSARHVFAPLVRNRISTAAPAL